MTTDSNLHVYQHRKGRTSKLIDNILGLSINVIVSHVVLRSCNGALRCVRSTQGSVRPTTRTRGVRKRSQDNTEPVGSVLREK